MWSCTGTRNREGKTNKHLFRLPPSNAIELSLTTTSSKQSLDAGRSIPHQSNLRLSRLQATLPSTGLAWPAKAMHRWLVGLLQNRTDCSSHRRPLKQLVCGIVSIVSRTSNFNKHYDIPTDKKITTINLNLRKSRWSRRKTLWRLVQLQQELPSQLRSLVLRYRFQEQWWLTF